MSAFDLLASLVLDDGRRWGEAALDFQRADARAVLDQSGRRRHYWTRPRGASKTTDLAGVGAAALLDQLAPNARGYVYAADRDQAGLLLDSVAGFVDRTPELGSALTVGASMVTANRSKATLTVESSDDASAWGKRPALTILEELAVWRTTRGPTRLLAAVMSAVPKVPDSRLVVLSMAGDPAHPAYRLLERARASSSWVVSEVPGPCPWWSPEDVAEAKADLTDSDFRRLVLGEWAEPEDRLTTTEDVRACVTDARGVLAFEPGNRYVMGLDIGLKNDRTVLTVAHAEPVVLGGEEGPEASMVVVDRQECWSGTRAAPVDLSEVEAVIVEAWLGYGRPTLVADPYQAAQLTQRLRRRGVKVIEYAFSQQSIGRLTLTLYRLLRDHLLDLPDDPELIEELATVRLEERSPGSYRIDHDSGAHDDRVISLALAAHHLIAGPVRRKVRSAGWLGGVA